MFAVAQHLTPAKFNSRYLSNVSRMHFTDLDCIDNTNVIRCISRHKPHIWRDVEALLLVIRSILDVICLHTNDTVPDTVIQLSNVINVQREVALNGFPYQQSFCCVYGYAAIFKSFDLEK